MDYSTFPTPSPKHETLEFIKRFARLQHIADTALVEGLKVHILCPQANRRGVLNAQNGLNEKILLLGSGELGKEFYDRGPTFGTVCRGL